MVTELPVEPELDDWLVDDDGPLDTDVVLAEDEAVEAVEDAATAPARSLPVMTLFFGAAAATLCVAVVAIALL